MDIQAAPVQGQKSGSHLFLQVFPSIMLPMFLAMSDQTMVSTALPAIVHALGGVERISWVVVSYLVAITVAAPVYGRLGDMYGRRRLLCFGLFVVMGASVVCAVAPTIEILVLGRVLQGLGGGGLMTLSQALIGESIPPRDRARYQGYLAAVGVSASTFGPVMGGILAQYLGWRSVFVVNLPISALAILLALRLPRRPLTVREPGRFDWIGLVLFATFVTSTLLTLSCSRSGPQEAAASDLALACLSLLACVILIIHERRSPRPLLPLALFRNKAIWRSDLVAAFHGGTLVSLVTFMPMYLHVVRGASAAHSGLLLLPLTAGVGMGSLLTGRMVSLTGHTAIFPTWGLAVASIGIAFVAFRAPLLSTEMLIGVFVFISLSLGTVMGVVQVTVQVAAGPSMLGAASGAAQFSRSIGAAFGTAIVGTVLFSVMAANGSDALHLFTHMIEAGAEMVEAARGDGGSALSDTISNGFRAAFLTVAVFAACGAGVAATIPLRKIP